ncbi:MAG: FAD-binding oxidoreductase [Planctomycetota bacterium]
MVLQPRSEAEVSAILSWANEQHVPAVPRGGGTKMGLGRLFSQTQEFICLSLKQMNQIVEHDADNLTVTVEAGATLKDLQTRISEKRQFLPLDPPGSEDATVGGVLAANASGPRRFGYGSARDFVLGLRVVAPDGRLLKFGGKSVKNVAGYDMCKLFIGSFGTLGVIAEATFRLVPLPTTRRTVVQTFDSLEAASGAVRGLLASCLLPSAIELVDRVAADHIFPVCNLKADGSHAVAVLFEGFQDAVERQARELSNKNPGRFATLAPDEAERFWAALAGLLGSGTGGTRCKVSVPIASVAPIVAMATNLPAATVSHAGSGIVYVFIPPEASRPDRAVTRLRREAEDAGGHIVVESAPREVKEKADPWGKAGSAEAIMRRLRETFDPNGIMNPGRFIV